MPIKALALRPKTKPMWFYKPLSVLLVKPLGHQDLCRDIKPIGYERVCERPAQPAAMLASYSKFL